MIYILSLFITVEEDITEYREVVIDEKIEGNG